MKIEMRLSAKVDYSGMSEILLCAKKKIEGRTVSMRASSGIKIEPVFFSPTVGVDLNRKRVMKPSTRQHHIEAKQKLDGLLSTVAAEEPSDRAGVLKMNKDWLRSIVERYMHPERYGQSSPASLFDMADEFLRTGDFGESYRKQTLTALRALARFEEYVKQTRDPHFRLDIETVGRDTMEQFRAYLRKEHSLWVEYPRVFARIFAALPESLREASPRPIFERGDNDIHGKIKRVKAFWNWMLETGRTENNPFAAFRNTAERYGVPYYLTIEERDRLAAAPMPTASLTVQRDIFVFQCFIGCRVSDLMELSERNIVNGILSYVPQKTHRETTPTMARVPLHPTASALIEKYKGVDPKGRLMPFISAQKYNDAIKEMFRLAGIDRCVPVRNSLSGVDELRPLYEVASSHLARRTFVANLYLHVQDPALIGKMSGHTENSRAFARYRKIEDEVLENVVNKYL